MSLCFPSNEYRRGLFCTPIPSLVRSFRSISDSFIQYLYIFDTIYHLIFHLNRFKFYFIIFWSFKFLKSFDIQVKTCKGSWRVKEKRKKRREKKIEIFDRGIRTSDCISVKGVLVLNRAWSHSSLKITRKKDFSSRI